MEEGEEVVERGKVMGGRCSGLKWKKDRMRFKATDEDYETEKTLESEKTTLERNCMA